MFASAGKTLQIYSLERNGLKSICKYSPKLEKEIKQISWCHDYSYIALLQENEPPQILSVKDPNTHLVLVHTISSVLNVSALKFKSNTKRILALGTKNGELLLYDTKNRCIATTITQLPWEVVALDFYTSNDVAAISNQSLFILNLESANKVELENPDVCTTLKCLNKLQRHLICVGCNNGIVVLWDAENQTKLHQYHFHNRSITGITASLKDKLLVTSGMDNKLCIIDIKTSKESVFKKILHQPITAVEISGCELFMVAGLQDGSIYVYQMSDHLKPQIFSRMHLTSINQVSFINELPMELMENKCNLGDLRETGIQQEMELCEITYNKVTDLDSVESVLNVENDDSIRDLNKSRLQSSTEDNLEISEDKVKLDLIKLINKNYIDFESQLGEHCGRLQVLISSELDSLYSVAARWECFNSMELEDIVRYICGVASTPSETEILTKKSEHDHLAE